MRAGSLLLLFSSLSVLLACGGRAESTSIEPPVADEPLGRLPDPDPPRKQGSVSMFTVEQSALFAYARFSAAAGASRTASHGKCSLWSAYESDDEGEVSAGDVVIDLLGSPGKPRVKLVFDPDEKRYVGDALDVLPPAAGSLIAIRASGAKVPPFDASLRAADDVVFEEPADGLEVSASSTDIPVRWTESDNDEVFVDLALGDDSVSCTFDAHAGGGVIPGRLVREVVLAYADAGSPECTFPTCMLYLSSIRRTAVRAGDYDVALSHGVSGIRSVRVAE